MLERHLFSHIPDLEIDSDGQSHFTVEDTWLFITLRHTSVAVTDLTDGQKDAIEHHIQVEQKLAGMKDMPQTDMQYQLALRDRDASNALMPRVLQRKHKG